MFRNMKWVMLGTLWMVLAGAPAVMLAHDSGKFSVDQTLLLKGNKIKSGVYQVKFAPNKQDAMVTFKLHGRVAAEVQGKIVEAKKPYDYDAMVLAKDSSGREILKALQFGGEKVEIMF